MPLVQTKPQILFIKNRITFGVLVGFAFGLLGLTTLAEAQAPVKPSSADMQLQLDKLTKCVSVLYVAAHPDDENTRFIAYMAKARLAETGYISLTRGDGGQNLIGPELNEELGAIRTQELLAARRIDGGQQFFTRAKDFGFSKNPTETFSIWPRDKVLADLVWVIRQRQPDIIITRFSTIPGGTHGHHTASAMLAQQAFTAAADPTQFAEQLAYVKPWQAKRVYWNTSSFFFKTDKDFNTVGLIKQDVGAYSPELGLSLPDIAATSRSQHRSQGFGSAGQRGPVIEYFQYIAGDSAKTSLFDGIDTTWGKYGGTANLQQALQCAASQFNARKPYLVVPYLFEAKRLLEANPSKSFIKSRKLESINQLIPQLLGVYTEAASTKDEGVKGQPIKLNLEVSARLFDASKSLTCNKIVAGGYSITPKDTSINIAFSQNGTKKLPFIITASSADSVPYSTPYWLSNLSDKGLFNVYNQYLIGKGESDPCATIRFVMQYGVDTFSVSSPVRYKEVDPTKGEIWQPFNILPAILVDPVDKLCIMASPNTDLSGREIQVKVSSNAGAHTVSVSLGYQEGIATSPAFHTVDLAATGDSKLITFVLQPSSYNTTPLYPNLVTITAVEKNKPTPYTQRKKSLVYDHIPTQVLLKPAAVVVVNSPIKCAAQHIAYLQGAGDEVPQILRRQGLTVTIIDRKDFTLARLKQFDCVVLGIRAFNTQSWLKAQNNLLCKYVKDGGNVIAQYNTVNFVSTVPDSIGPYRLNLSNDRVTNEDAPITILQPQHPAVTFPNQITAEDFKGWVQERGLYFARTWAPDYTPIISCADLNENPSEGALLVGKYGKGYFTYTGISFFRQLPAGNPGAMRLFSNLLSLGKVPVLKVLTKPTKK